MFPMYVRTFLRRLTSGPSWACKTCGQAPQPVLARHANMRLQYNDSTVDYSPGTATVPDDPTTRRHAADQVWCGRMTRPGVPTQLKDPTTLGHLSGPWSLCNCPALSYKSPGRRQEQGVFRTARTSTLHKFNSALNSATHTRIQHSLRGRRVLRSGSPNHVNHRVHPA
jgi:hypothetical protein